MEKYNDDEGKLTAKGLTDISAEYPQLPMWITKMAVDLYNKDPVAFEKLDWEKMVDTGMTAEQFGGGSDVFKKVEPATEWVEGAEIIVEAIDTE